MSDSDIDSKRAVVAAADEDSNATDEDPSLWEKARKIAGQGGSPAKRSAPKPVSPPSDDESPPPSPALPKTRTLSGFLMKGSAPQSAHAKPAAASPARATEEKKAKRQGDDDSGSGTEPDEALLHSAKKAKAASSDDEPIKAVITGKKYSTKPMNLKHRTGEMAAQAHPNYNEKLTKILAEMGGIEKSNGVVHKFKAYQKAVQALKSYPKAITSGAEAQKELDGVGKKIAKKIDEILATGSLKKLEKYHADPRQRAISLFSKVAGIGPVAAKKFVDEDGLRTLEDLKAISHTLNHHQQVGLKYFQELEQRVPREEVGEVEGIVKHTAAAIDPAYELLVAGSYRRGTADSGDIDILVTHPKFEQGSSKYLTAIVNKLKERKLITDDVVFGKVKYMGICQLPGKPHRHLDIRIFNPAHFPCAVLYFTGSDLFNTQMRLIALEKGFTLNEYEVCKLSDDGTKGAPIKVKNEKDIFDVLGMQYRKPEERNIG